jgi:uncharacterized protein YjiK
MRIIIWIVAIVLTLVVLYLVQQVIENKVALAENKYSNEVLKSTSNYLINQPDQTLFLSSKLKEVSGLSTAKVDSVILTIQDEKGLIYHINKSDGRILREEKFAGKGDYEGIERVGDTTYIVTSNGDIYCYSDAEDETQIHKTDLEVSQDIEGLGYSPELHALLVACKGRKNGEEKHLRSIYAFDLATKKLSSQPLFVIDGKEIAEKLKREKPTPYFSPSAIAMTRDGAYYILSSVAKALIVVEKNGKCRSGVNLSGALHSQPEGILLDNNNTLYISNEGRDGVAKIYVYHPKAK